MTLLPGGVSGNPAAQVPTVAQASAGAPSLGDGQGSPREVPADNDMCSDSEAPWSGGRGLPCAFSQCVRGEWACPPETPTAAIPPESRVPGGGCTGA